MSRSVYMEKFKKDFPHFVSAKGYWGDGEGKVINISEDMSKNYIKSCINMCKKLQGNDRYCDGRNDVYELLQCKIDDLKEGL